MAGKIEGVPDGWELVHANRPALTGEYFIDSDATVSQWDNSYKSVFTYPIVRKIEKPARYRPFANASEADQFWNVALRYRSSLAESKHSRFRINTIGLDGITIGLEFYSYKDAFRTFCVDDDGTPFGVRIDE
jgi:hypothetical protein